MIKTVLQVQTISHEEMDSVPVRIYTIHSPV